MSDKNTSVWHLVKVALTLIPAIALILACFHYSVMFRHFSGLNLTILSATDYLNKSFEFIPTAAFCALLAIWSFWSYPTRWESESEEQHYKRIGGDKAITSEGV